MLILGLHGGYGALLGPGGMALSGGQRQRIGLARAFYKNADVIILDEATSALDGDTESAVMRALEILDDKVTVIIVAHRLATLRHCNKIVRLKGGVVESIGSYADLSVEEVH